MKELRVLVPGDEARLFEFLEPYVDTSVFFFSNIEKGGLVDHGAALQATYVARLSESGAITAVAGHAWNGNVMVQGEVGLEEAAVEAVSRSGRAVKGLVGPWSLVCRARKALGLDAVKAAHDGREVLMSLSLDQLQEPALLSRPDVALRVPTLAEALGPLLEWRIAYMVESLGGTRDATLETSCRATMEGWLRGGTLWVLTLAGELVSMTGFNAQARGIVQVGGVYTPPAWRSRSYARAAVAGSLKLARDKGATRSVLFTSEENPAAQAAYHRLGYRITGDYGLVLF